MMNRYSSALLSSSATTAGTGKRVAFLLAGCGSRDGSEITEAVSLMIALAQEGFSLSFFAPDRIQHHVLNHRSGAEDLTPRNMLDEAARIARGAIKPLAELRAQEHDALVIAGGFGVAKNLCNFAFEGAAAKLAPDARDALLNFMLAQKPLAALCIAPVLLALGAQELGWRGVRITLGDGSATDAIKAVEGWGATAIPCCSGKACIDSDRKFVTAPAYMIDGANSADIFACAKALVSGLCELLQ